MLPLRWTLVLVLCQATPSHEVTKSVLLKAPAGSEKYVGAIMKKFRDYCPGYVLSTTAENFDFTLVAIPGMAVYDRDGRIVRWSDASILSNQVKDICEALDTATLIDVVDVDNLTQSSDLRGAPVQGAPGVAEAIAGRRRTHTDNTTLNIIANGEHALLDCYEHHKGCTTIAPGKYYGEVLNDSIWIEYDMPITHEHMRNHYVIAGSW
jgi:hypothetical protein